MKFKIIKASFDGICGGESRYDTIDEVLREVSYSKGWDSKEQMHAAIQRWAENADPGSVFCTSVTAIVAVGVATLEGSDCPMCGCENTDFDYGKFEPIEGECLEQKATCSECGATWVDVFGLIDRRMLNPKDKS